MGRKKNTDKYARRTWLNADEERLAFVATRTNAEVHDRDGGEWSSGSVCGTVTIGDCNRKIDLDFDVYWGNNVGEPDAEEGAMAVAQLDKLDTLLGELREFRRQYVLRLRQQGLIK